MKYTNMTAHVQEAGQLNWYIERYEMDYRDQVMKKLPIWMREEMERKYREKDEVK